MQYFDNMNKFIHIIVFLGMAAWIVSCSSSGKPAGRGAMNAVPVNTFTVKEGRVTYYDSYPATIVAMQQVDLRSEVTGYVTGIFFKEGQQVKKGQKLYEIDRTNYIANYNQAKSSVEIAQANLDKAQRDADRYKALHQQQAIAEQTYDDAMTALKNAQLQLMSAKAALAKATSDLNYSLIKAPFNGTIGISQVRMGTLVTPGQTLLNTISSDDPMGVDFQVNSEQIGRFQELDKQKFSPDDSLFRIKLPDNSIYPFSGHISIIDRAFDPQTGTITIRLAFPNKERMLKPGMSCNVQVYNNPDKSVIVIPYKAVSEQMGEFFVFLVQGDKARQVKISMGERIGGNVIINQGLTSGDVIVTDGIQKLHDGSAIQTGTSGGNKGKNPA